MRRRIWKNLRKQISSLILGMFCTQRRDPEFILEELAETSSHCIPDLIDQAQGAGGEDEEKEKRKKKERKNRKKRGKEGGWSSATEEESSWGRWNAPFVCSMRKNSSTLRHQLDSQLCRQNKVPCHSQSSCQIDLQSLRQILTILFKKCLVWSRSWSRSRLEPVKCTSMSTNTISFKS